LRFAEQVRAAEKRNNSLVCVGLDPDISRFPAHLRDLEPKRALIEFCVAIIDATSDLVSAYKPNLGFFMAHGIAGLEALVEIRRRIPVTVPVILDAKTGDMATTAAAYARGYFDAWNFDAVTVNPFQGEDSLAPFFTYPDRGVIVLCKTSNPGGAELQDQLTGEANRQPVYLTLADRIQNWSERYPASLGLVVGATYPRHLVEIRRRCPELPILLPGIGAQAGDLEGSIRAGIDAQGGALLASASRSILYAGSGVDFATIARAEVEKLRNQINIIRVE
jgi:orotidine-5'-phosphate decarboxylase